MAQLTLTPLLGIPEVTAQHDVGQLVCQGLKTTNIVPKPFDVIAIAQKIVSKAEDRCVSLATVEPSAQAYKVAEQTGKDPRLVELILQESAEISRFKKGVLITRHRLGFVSANSAIDRSNVPQNKNENRVLLLPQEPDQSAQKIRETLWQTLHVKIGIVITDTHGRPHRLGAAGVAIGVAGIPAILDERGKYDRNGYELKATQLAVADEIASAASLLMGAAAESNPIIHIRGLTLIGKGKASDQYRSIDLDLYR